MASQIETEQKSMQLTSTTALPCSDIEESNNKWMLLTSNTVLLHSKDDEANQDLSLKVLEKAENATQIDDIIEASEVPKDDNSVSTQIDDIIEASEVPKDDNIVSISTGMKKEIEKTDWTEVGDDHNVIVDREIKDTVGCESLESSKSIEDKVHLSDNIVLRKLLRGPRYFDPPNSGRGSCYNCGEDGHTAVCCTLAKRKRPCFVCGSLDHNAKQCAKGQDCFICKKGGHRAKNCPETKVAGLYLSAKVCLKCGQSGHEMFSCKSDYASDDLKEIQCYICKDFGHLCCAAYTFTVGGIVSCYRCGQSGHTGLACKGLHGEINDVETPSSCYKCGKGGHFARDCTTSAKHSFHTAIHKISWGPNKMESPSTCYKCGQEGHFSRECTNSAKASTRSRGEQKNQTKSPSSCYKCGGEGHFVRECSNSPVVYTRLQGGLFEMESSSCYRCGGKGHFARECTSSVEAHTRLHEYPGGSGSNSSCYKCGEGGHFARKCTNSVKSLKRIRELSAPKDKLSKPKKDSFDRKSWPCDLGKARKRKRNQYEGEFSTPVKPKSRGGWTTEHPGDLPRHKSRNKGWKSPATPTSKHKKLQKSSGGDYASNSRSPRNFRKFQSNNSTSNNSKLCDGFSAREFHSDGN